MVKTWLMIVRRTLSSKSSSVTYINDRSRTSTVSRPFHLEEDLLQDDATEGVTSDERYYSNE